MSPIGYKPQAYTRNNKLISLSDVLFVEDFIIAQNDEWKRDQDHRHCPSGILSPYLATINQLALLNRSAAVQVGFYVISPSLLL